MAKSKLEISIKTKATPFAILDGKMLKLDGAGKGSRSIEVGDFVPFEYILVGTPGTTAAIDLTTADEKKKVEVKQKKVKLPLEDSIAGDVHFRKNSFDVRIVVEEDK